MIRIAVVLLALSLTACASPPKELLGNSEYRATPYMSTVTVTGNAVPGPLEVREVSAWLGDGGETLKVAPRSSVSATFSAWINGHGQLVGYWERDGEEIDRVSVYITYGETLQVTLSGPTLLPTNLAGRHEIRFVLEKPEGGLQAPMLTYEVEE
jgi:hypothetical protein